MAANFGRGGAYAPLPTEEHVAVCTRDGDSVRCWGGEVRERVVRCRECVHWHDGMCWRNAYLTSDSHGSEFMEGLFRMDASDFCSLGELDVAGDDE